jgi:predicted outer membrane repeat protein
MDAQKHSMPWKSLLTAAAILTLIAALIPTSARAATLTVDRTDDDPTATACTAAPNDCSLRGALIATNGDAILDTILLPAGTYTLDEVGTGENSALDGDLDVQSDLVIIGDGAATTIIDGNSNVTGEPVFTVFGDQTAEFNNITITGGNGGIINFGTLTLNDCKVDGNNSTTVGGGIYTGGSLELSGTTVSNNSSQSFGGGIYVYQGSLTISNSVVEFNQSPSTAGGGIFQDSGTLDVSYTRFSGNTAGAGGAISSSGTTVILDHMTFETNQALTYNGGALYIDGVTTLTITESSFAENIAAGSGGAANLVSGTNAAIDNSTFAYNISNDTGSDGGGGAIQVTSSTLTMTNSTVIGNSAKQNGGGIFAYYGTVSVDLIHTTVTDNIPNSDSIGFGFGGGVYALDGTLTLTNSILAANSGLQCNYAGAGMVVSGGYNIDTDNSCNLTAPGDQPSTGPFLGVWKDNGGSTYTRAPLPGSPAIDVIPAGVNGCGTSYTMDQRGWPRPVGSSCDAGSVEAPVWIFLPVIQK